MNLDTMKNGNGDWIGLQGHEHDPTGIKRKDVRGQRAHTHTEICVCIYIYMYYIHKPEHVGRQAGRLTGR